MSLVVKKGTTDVSVVIRIIDSADGTPETGVTSATGGLDLEYRREGAVSTDITEADLTNLNDAHSDGGLKHIGNGYYRLDLPDAACASGASGVLVHGTATGMVVIGEYVQLVDYDPFDAVRLGLTALPNAAADAAGGLPISDAGGLDLDAQVGTKINDILTDTGTTLDGKLDTIDTNVDAILVDTAEIGVAGAGLTEAGGTGDHLTALATATLLTTVAGYLDTEIAAILADTNELQTDWADGGRLDLILDARASQTSVDTIDDFLDTEIAAILADTNELQGDWTNGGRLDLILDAILDDTDLIDDGTSGLAKIATDVAAILVDTGTTLQAELDGIQADTEDIQSRLPAALVGGRIDATVDGTGMEAGATAAIVAAVFTTAMTESYRSAGAAGTLAQYVHEIIAHLGEFAISGTTKTTKRLDGSTTAKTYTLDDDTSPTSITEAT